MSAARAIAIVSWLTTPTGRHRQARETAERSTRGFRDDDRDLRATMTWCVRD
jgi:hypothetical protein